VNSPRLPNFLIVGTGKAGTTSLHSYLQQHPQIYMSPVKEPTYFASEIRADYLEQALQRHLAKQTRYLARRLNDGLPVKPMGWLTSDWNDYLRLFQHVGDEVAVGEASPIYLWSPTAAANIHERIPDARIVMVLRDPAERAYSQYLHQLTVGLTKATFHEHLDECVRDDHHPMGIHHPFLEVGLYYRQVERYLNLFPRDHVRIYWYEEDWKQPATMLRDLFGFLGVDPSFHPDTSRREHARRAPRWAGMHYLLKQSRVWESMAPMVPQSVRGLAFQKGRKMESQDRRFLVDYYAEDVRRLSELLHKDLSAWLQT